MELRVGFSLEEVVVEGGSPELTSRPVGEEVLEGSRSIWSSPAVVEMETLLIPGLAGVQRPRLMSSSVDGEEETEAAPLGMITKTPNSIFPLAEWLIPVGKHPYASRSERFRRRQRRTETACSAPKKTTATS